MTRWAPRALGAAVACALLTALPSPVSGLGAQEALRPLPSGARWVGPGGRALPFRTDAQAEEFLRHAEVVSSRLFGEGITGLRQLVLEREGVRARAAFHTIDEVSRNQRMDSGYFRIYHDSYRGQCAAYAVARLLRLDNVPPVVCRRVDGVEGSVQLWVEGALLEEERAEHGLDPPVARDWMRQLHRMRLLDRLIYNDDRHANNYLYDGNWKLWLIDHTRAFQVRDELPTVEAGLLYERQVWERLQSISADELKEAVREYLSPSQVNSLGRRLELLVEEIRGLIAERGEGAVLLDDTCLAANC